jgi:hypothetical protein
MGVERSGDNRTQPLNKDGGLVVLQCDKRDLLPIRRHHGRSGHDQREIESRGPLDLSPHQLLRQSQPLRIHRGQHDRGHSQHPSQGSRGEQDFLPVLFLRDHQRECLRYERQEKMIISETGFVRSS